MDNGASRLLGLIRLAVGLAQGVVLYFLYQSAQAHSWPSSERFAFAPLTLLAIFLPLVVMLGAGGMRRRTLLLWTGLTAAVLVGLAIYSVFRVDAVSAVDVAKYISVGGFVSIVPGLAWVVALTLFIGQSLLVAGDAGRKIIAEYPRYFDAAWKLELQLLLTMLFVGLFWLLLYLGASLLALIHVDFLKRVIELASFYLPASTLAIAAAIHLTDVRSGIIESTRNLIHIVLSWLLPLIAAIVAVFLIALPFTGLGTLWKTEHAAMLLLGVAAALTFLINTVYRDGSPERLAPRVLRICGLVAMIELLPIVAIASIAVGLRVGQHGWTDRRVLAAAATSVALCYVVGYLPAVVRRSGRLLEVTNILTAFVIVTVLLALHSPLADPARVSVASQVGRLKSGQTPPEKFDYAYLRWRGARYGRDALESLKSYDGEQASLIREDANKALSATSPFPQPLAPTPEGLAGTITVYPEGKSLPPSFFAQQWPRENRWNLPQCLFNKKLRCEALMVDLDGDGTDDVVLVEIDSGKTAMVFKNGSDGNWGAAGRFSGDFFCPGVLESVREGRFTLTPVARKDVQAAGRTLRLQPPFVFDFNCN